MCHYFITISNSYMQLVIPLLYHFCLVMCHRFTIYNSYMQFLIPTVARSVTLHLYVRVRCAPDNAIMHLGYLYSYENFWSDSHVSNLYLCSADRTRLKHVQGPFIFILHSRASMHMLSRTRTCTRCVHAFTHNMHATWPFETQKYLHCCKNISG